MMSRAGDWFAGWRQDCLKTSDSLTRENYQKPYMKREGWARKKRLDADTQGNIAMGIGGVEPVNDDVWQGEQDWNTAGYVDDDGQWRSDEQWFQRGNEGPMGDEGGVILVNK